MKLIAKVSIIDDVKRNRYLQANIEFGKNGQSTEVAFEVVAE